MDKMVEDRPYEFNGTHYSLTAYRDSDPQGDRNLIFVVRELEGSKVPLRQNSEALTKDLCEGKGVMNDQTKGADLVERKADGKLEMHIYGVFRQDQNPLQHDLPLKEYEQAIKDRKLEPQWTATTQYKGSRETTHEELSKMTGHQQKQAPEPEWDR